MMLYQKYIKKKIIDDRPTNLRMGINNPQTSFFPIYENMKIIDGRNEKKISQNRGYC